MYRFKRRALTLSMASLLIISSFGLSVEASEADGKPYLDPQVKTAYLPAIDMTNYGCNTNFYIMNVNEKTKVTKFKSSNEKIVKPLEIQRYSSHTDVESMIGEEDRNYDSYSIGLCVELCKPGSAKISALVDGKKLTGTMNVLKYKNPLASCKISSLNKNAELKSKSDQTSFVYLKAPTKKSKTNIKVKAAKGYRIRSVRYDNYSTGREATLKYGDVYQNSVGSLSMSAMDIKPGEQGRISVYTVDRNNVDQVITYMYN